MKVLQWFSSQKTHFLTLSKPERSLLLSFFLFGLASPIIYTYSNTFIWRQGEDPLALIFFNIAFYAVIPIGFFFNHLAFKISDVPRLYFFGCLLQGIVPFLLVFSNASSTLIPLFGAILGLAGGFYWANRNYLTSKISQGSHRLYFFSIEGVFETIAAVIAPISIGWLLILGQRLNLYSVESAYRIAAIITLLILFWAGRVVVTAGLPPCVNELKQLFLKKPEGTWNRLRIMEVLHGFVTGVEMILPTVIILTVLGAEETVGTIDSLTAIFSGLLLGVLSRKIKHKHHLLILVIWTLGAVIGGLGFALLFSASGAILYFIASGLTSSFRWTSLMTIMYEIVDHVVEKSTTHRFVYIMDRELFLALGRIAALLLLFILYTSLPVITTRFGLLLIALGQIALIAVTKPLLTHILHKPTPMMVAADPT